MVTFGRSSNGRKQSESLRPTAYIVIGIFAGFFLGVSFHTFVGSSLCLTTNVSIVSTNIHDNLPSPVPTSKNVTTKCANKIDNNLIEAQKFNSTTKIWIPSNPRGAESLPPKIIEAETDLYPRRLWGKPSEDLKTQPKYLMAFTVGYSQRKNIDAGIKKLSSNFSIVLFHYDGQTTEWNEFEWANRVVHISVPKQTKWWYAKRFLHPDVVAKYDYIFVWDEDLGIENFDAEKYIELVRKHGLEVSQPGVEPGNRRLIWQMTQRRKNGEVHKQTEERPGWCSDPHTPPCAGFVEIMAPVFSRAAWRCVWYMIQNDLVHGWGLDFALRKCVEPAHKKIGVVDAQWIVHQGIPSLGNQGEGESSKTPWHGVRKRCEKEWKMFQNRVENAEKAYYRSIGIEPPNSTVAQGIDRIITGKRS